jgi:hypothetical protein
MLPTESVEGFKSFALGRGVSVLTVAPRAGFAETLDFYAAVRAEGCTGESGDMLLFQSGTDDWGNGAAYEVSPNIVLNRMIQ